MVESWCLRRKFAECGMTTVAASVLDKDSDVALRRATKVYDSVRKALTE